MSDPNLPIQQTDDGYSAEVTLCNRRGLHARASAKFCAAASAWDASVKVSKDGYTVGGCSIMGLLTLAASIGCKVTITATGPQAREAVEVLVLLVKDRFGEEE